jgi:hypothetical protein
MVFIQVIAQVDLVDLKLTDGLSGFEDLDLGFT